MEKMMLKPAELCEEILDTYSKKVEYPTLKSAILGFLAGVFIALGGFAAAVASHSIENAGVAKFVAGAVFPVGLIIILICGLDLFTGNVLIAVPVADGRVKVKKMIKNWFIIYVSNFVGAFTVALLVFYSGSLDINNSMLGGYALKVAATKASLPFTTALASGILCNILVCVAVWVSFAAKEIAGKVLAIWFPIMAFIIGGFEHCVANMYYFSIGILAKTNSEKFASAYHVSEEKIAHINFEGILNNVIAVTLGNIIGGALFVGIAIWGAYVYAYKNKQH